MIVCKTKSELDTFFNSIDGGSDAVGFVPTMGALHRGHIALVKQCRSECKTTVVSIFVNPLQFNDASDYEKYPQTLDSDLHMLENAGCEMVFVPSVKEMYPDTSVRKYDLGLLETVMEGKFRPGHYQGVASVVDRLFTMVKPGKAYFGAKDYQQIMIIKRMLDITGQPVELVICPTVRENDGLAMSSRNMRLSAEERKSAPAIYYQLSQVAGWVREEGIAAACLKFEDHINNVPFLRCEYIEITDSETLMPVTDARKDRVLAAFVSVYCGNIRLIDNVFFVA